MLRHEKRLIIACSWLSFDVQSYSISFVHGTSCVVAWEVSAGESGKVCVMRSPNVVINRTNIPMDVTVSRGTRVDNVGEVNGPGVCPVPLMLASPESLCIRPSLGGV